MKNIDLTKEQIKTIIDFIAGAIKASIIRGDIDAVQYDIAVVDMFEDILRACNLISPNGKPFQAMLTESLTAIDASISYSDIEAHETELQRAHDEKASASTGDDDKDSDGASDGDLDSNRVLH